MQFCIGHPLYCSSHALQTRRYTAVWSHRKPLGRVSLYRVVAKKNPPSKRKKKGPSKRAQKKKKNTEVVVKVCKNLVVSIDSGEVQGWDEFKRIALSEMSSFTPKMTSRMLALCRKAKICDEELLDSLLRVGLDDEEYMLGFTAKTVGNCLDDLGVLFQHAKKEGKWKGRSMIKLCKEFAVNLTTTHMENNMFTASGFNGACLSVLLKGLGKIFKRRKDGSIDPMVLEIAKALVAAFLRVYHSSKTGAANTVAVLRACAILGLKKGDAFISEAEVCDLVEGIVKAKIKINSLSLVVWSMGRMGFDYGTALDLLTEKITKGKQLAALHFRGLSNIVYAFGLLKYYNPDVLDKISAESAKKKKLRDAEERHLSNIVHGFGVLGYCNSDVLHDILAEITKKSRLRVFKQQQLSNIVFGLGLLKYRKSVSLRKKIACEVSKEHRLRSFQNEDLSNAVYGFGLMKYRIPFVLDKIADEVTSENRLESFSEKSLSDLVYGFGLTKYNNLDGLEKLCGEIVKDERLRSFSEKDLSNIVYGLGRLKYSDSDVLSRICGEIGRIERVRSFKEGELSDIVFGLGWIRYLDSKALGKLAGEIVRKERLGSFSHEELSTIVWGLGRLEYYDADVVSKVCGEIWSKKRIRSFSRKDVVTMIQGLSNMGYVNTYLFDQLLNKYMEIGDVDENENPVSGVHLSMMMVACANLNHHNQKFFDFVVSWVGEKSDSIESIRIFCNILLGLSILEILEVGFFLDACKKIEEIRLKGVGMDKSNWRRTAQAWMYLAMVKRENLDLPDDIKALVEKAMEVCRLDVDVTTSNFERDVSKYLTKMGVAFQKDVPVADGLIRVDMLVAERQPKVVIECDGPFHYASNKPDGKFMVLGATLLRNRILESHGYKVVCIPYFFPKSRWSYLLEPALEDDS